MQDSRCKGQVVHGNTIGGVAHFTHLGELFGGWLGVQYFRGRGLFGKR
jgi:hypothetical protein